MNERAEERIRIAGGRVVAAAGPIEADVEVEGGLVLAIGPRLDEGPSAAARTVEASGRTVAAGFVDLQINGACGRDLTSDPASIWDVGAFLPRTGVTAFLPTIVSSLPSTVRRALEVLAEGPPRGYVGARPLGLHCEGPMLAPTHRGAHDARLLQPPSGDVIEGWSRAAGVRLVTLAPELEGADPVIEALLDRGVVVSIGHSGATFERATSAFTSGVSAGTHLFNAMSGFAHRAPGVAGALLASPVPAGLIVDGVHVHPGAVRAAWRAKRPRGIALVTDAVAALGASLEAADAPSLAGSPLVVDGDVVRDRTGTLAGSTLSMDRAVRNLVAFAGASVDEALAAASATPASMIGERGVLEPGAVADIVILDEELEVVATLVGGHVAFERDDARTAPPRRIG
jgi:N-acetylglucosamine-6-phosphate deacetylase